MPPRPRPPTSAGDDAILDAARTQLLRVGWKRVTLTDVARRADVSRMTIYRRWPDVQELMADVMTREWTVIGEEVIGSTPAKGAGATREDVVATVLEVATSMRGSDLFRRIVDVDPEMLLPYLIERRGRTQQVLIDMLRPAIVSAQASGLVRAGDPDRVTASVVLACHGYVISAGTFADVADETALAADLGELIDRFLTP